MQKIIKSPLPVEFYDYLCTVPEVINIIENVDGVFLAGGLLRSLVGGEDINPQSTDIDLFFGHPEILEGVKKYLDHPTSYYKKVFQCPENKLATYIYKREGKPEWKLQLISVDYYENAEEVIKTFDFTVTMFSTDGENFYQGEHSQEDVNNKKLVWNEITYPASSLRRMMKYARKGYHMREESYQFFVEKCWSHDSMIRDEKLVYVD